MVVVLLQTKSFWIRLPGISEYLNVIGSGTSAVLVHTKYGNYNIFIQIHYQKPSHVVFPKIRISSFFGDFTQKLGFQANYMDFWGPRGFEILKKAP